MWRMWACRVITQLHFASIAKVAVVVLCPTGQNGLKQILPLLSWWNALTARALAARYSRYANPFPAKAFMGVAAHTLRSALRGTNVTINKEKEQENDF